MNEQESSFWNAPTTSVLIFVLAFGLLAGLYYLRLPGETTEGSSEFRSALPEPRFPAAYAFDSLGWAPPDWSLRSVRGEEVSFQDLRGSVVVLNLWASWCLPCIAEMPSLAELQTRIGEHPVRVILLADEGLAAVASFEKEHDVGLPLYADATPRPAPFRVPNLPTTFILDPAGVVRWIQVGAVDWNHERVTEYLVSLVDLQV